MSFMPISLQQLLLLALALAAIPTAANQNQNQKPSDRDGDTTPFGHSMLRHFSIDDEYVNLNHGSFGAAPRVVQEAAADWRAVTGAVPMLVPMPIPMPTPMLPMPCMPCMFSPPRDAHAYVSHFFLPPCHASNDTALTLPTAHCYRGQRGPVLPLHRIRRARRGPLEAGPARGCGQL